MGVTVSLDTAAMMTAAYLGLSLTSVAPEWVRSRAGEVIRSCISHHRYRRGESDRGMRWERDCGGREREMGLEGNCGGKERGMGWESVYMFKEEGGRER